MRLVAPLTTLVFAPFLNIASAQLKDWGNRLEGDESLHPNGLRDYELLGFYSYLQDFPLRDDVSLRLRFFPPQENEAAFVEARGLTARKQYAMRPKDGTVKKLPNGWREFTGWPVRDVLKPAAIGSGNLGVIVRLKTNQEYEENLAPAILLDERQQIPAAVGDYVLYLKFGQSLKSLEYEVDGVSRYSQSYTYANPDNPKDASVASGIKTAIQFSARQIPAGPVTIHIAREYANSTKTAPEIVYYFYHKQL
jgi:hypothetical protein